MNDTSDTLTLRVSFESDWHLGDGAGQHGFIDRIVRRHPQDGLPYITAKTLIGIWRDACERVALGLDGGRAGGWSAWVEVLFGDEPAERERRRALGEPAASPAESPRSAVISVRPARLPESLRDLLAQSRPLRDALTFVKPGVRIDPETGQARSKHLRFEEVVRAGAELDAPVSLDGLAPEHREPALALLWAGAATVERLGGKRRRGTGRCRWTFDAADRDAALAVLAADPPAPPGPADRHPARTFPAAAQPAQGSAWWVIPLALEPRTPLVIPRAVVGNVVESHDFVPGTHLLAAVTRRLAALGVDPFPWVASGALRVCHAYPQVAGVRGRPVPMVIAHDKERGGLDREGGQVRNRLVDRLDSGTSGAPGHAAAATQWKPYRAGYLGAFDEPDQGLPAYARPALMMTAHATIEGEPQRPTEAVGGVYSYQGIRPDTHLSSEVWVRADLYARLEQAGPGWWRALGGPARLGRARKDDYGLVEVVPTAPEPRVASDRTPVEALRVWLLSDLLLRDDLLQPAPTLAALHGELERRLPAGVHLKPAGEHLLRARRTDGWHQGWGLPRPSYVGIAAGSCAVFEVAQGTLTRADCAALASAGLGERRGEGFGEVAIDDPLLRSALAGRMVGARPEPPVAPASPVREDEDQDAYLRLLRRSALRAWVRQAALVVAADRQFRSQILGWRKGRPGASQLGNLRRVLARLRGPGDQGANGVRRWLENVRKAGRWDIEALDAVGHAVRDPSFVDFWCWKSNEQTTGTIAPPGALYADVWCWLGLGCSRLPAEPIFLGLSAPAAARLRSELWAEAVRTLFAAAIRAERRARESGRTQEPTP